jgi:hypothetical protein
MSVITQLPPLRVSQRGFDVGFARPATATVRRRRLLAVGEVATNERAPADAAVWVAPNCRAFCLNSTGSTAMIHAAPLMHLIAPFRCRPHR